MTSRPVLDEYFMMMARIVGERATCTKLNVGALLVKDKQIIATGYNGAPRNQPHCTDIGCNRKDAAPGEEYHKCRSVHAEQNVIIQGATSSLDISNSTLYVTSFPCIQCVRMILNSKIERIVHATDVDRTNEIALDMLENSSIIVEEFKKNPEDLILDLLSG